jgi:tripartite-type tricarboxylate transporter receptor subunit TctC
VIISTAVPAAITDKINAAVIKAASSPRVSERFAAAGLEPNTRQCRRRNWGSL